MAVERSISDVRPNELQEFTAMSLLRGDWNLEPRSPVCSCGLKTDAVWTGSCPCQPFSLSGIRKEVLDERHLWPHWHDLSRGVPPFCDLWRAGCERRWPRLSSTLYQLTWKERTTPSVLVQICWTAGWGAPHIRQRLWFLADSGDTGSQGHAGRDGTVDGVDNSECLGRDAGRKWDHREHDGQQSSANVEDGSTGVADTQLNKQRVGGGTLGQDQAGDERGFRIQRTRRS